MIPLEFSASQKLALSWTTWMAAVLCWLNKNDILEQLVSTYIQGSGQGELFQFNVAKVFVNSKVFQAFLLVTGTWLYTDDRTVVRLGRCNTLQLI